MGVGLVACLGADLLALEGGIGGTRLTLPGADTTLGGGSSLATILLGRCLTGGGGRNSSTAGLRVIASGLPASLIRESTTLGLLVAA